MIYIEYITYVIYLEYDFTFPRLPGGRNAGKSEEHLSQYGHFVSWGSICCRTYIFPYFKKINIGNHTPTTVTSTLGDVDDTGITTAAILPVGASV